MSGDGERFPRMAIGDLLVLTLTVGVALAVVAPGLHDWLALPAEELRIPRWLGVVPEVTDYAAIGFSLFGVIVLGRQWWRRAAFRLQPGHWIFVVTGPYFLALLASGAVHQLLEANWFPGHSRHRGWESIFFFVVLAGSVIPCLRALRTPELRWRVCLSLVLVWLTLGAAECAQEARQPRFGLSSHLLALCATVYLIAFGSACVAVTIDLLRGVRRDWLHYFAMVMLTLYAVSCTLHYGALLARWWGWVYGYVFG